MTAYDDSWSETCSIGGRRIRLRLLRRSDRDRLTEGFHRLSDQGRYQRFLAAKTRLSDAELEYLTDIDQENHLAIGASEIAADGSDGRGLGIARFVRDADHPEVAEAAIAVIDEAQGQGLGRLLFNHLVAAARSRGVRRFRGEMLAENVAAMKLLEGIGAPVQRQIEAGITHIEVDLDGGEPRASKAYELLKLVAHDGVRIRRFLTWLDK